MHLPSRCKDLDINILSLPMMRQAIMYCYEPQRFLQRPPPPLPPPSLSTHLYLFDTLSLPASSPSSTPNCHPQPPPTSPISLVPSSAPSPPLS